jgi:PadR family transcriptional regulator PadR
VQSNWRVSDAGPPRRYYRITAEGDAALHTFAGHWGRFRDSVDGLIGAGADA